LVHPEDIERLRGKLAQHRDGQTSQFEDEHRLRARDGTYRWVLSRGFASRREDGTAFRMTGAQTDVNDRRSYDALTGLPNRARFEVFDSAMRDQVTEFMRTEGDLRRALERDELRVLYQPIVHVPTGVIVAFEALLRWQHPERGLLLPEDFLPVAEETGLIVP